MVVKGGFGGDLGWFRVVWWWFRVLVKGALVVV